MVNRLTPHSSFVRHRIFWTLVAIAVVMDLAHWLLNSIDHPFTGPIDTMIHLSSPIVCCLYGVAVMMIALRLATVAQRTKTSSQLFAWVLLIVGVLQAIAVAVTPGASCSSSVHHPMYPPFVGGVLMGGLTLLASRPLWSSTPIHLNRGARILAVIIALFWTVSHLTIDLLEVSESCARGVGPLWNTAFHNLLMVMVVFTAFGGLPDLLFSTHPDGLATLLAFGLPCALAWVGFGLRQAKFPRVVVLALGVSSATLAFRLGSWLQFILD